MSQVQLRVTAVLPLSPDMLENSTRLAALKPAIMEFAKALGTEARVETAIVKSKRELPVAQASRAGAEVLITPVAPAPMPEVQIDWPNRIRAAVTLAGPSGATADQLFADAGIPRVELMKAERAGLVQKDRQDGNRYYLALDAA